MLHIYLESTIIELENQLGRYHMRNAMMRARYASYVDSLDKKQEQLRGWLQYTEGVIRLLSQ